MYQLTDVSMNPVSPPHMPIQEVPGRHTTPHIKRAVQQRGQERRSAAVRQGRGPPRGASKRDAAGQALLRRVRGPAGQTQRTHDHGGTHRGKRASVHLQAAMHHTHVAQHMLAQHTHSLHTPHTNSTATPNTHAHTHRTDTTPHAQRTTHHVRRAAATARTTASS